MKFGRSFERLDRTSIDKTAEEKRNNSPLLGNTVSASEVKETRAFWDNMFRNTENVKKEENGAE